MRSYILTTLVLLISSGFINAGLFDRQPEDLKQTCTTDVDGKDRIPPQVIYSSCFDSAFCPAFPEMNKKHRLVLVDTTGGLTEREVSYLTSDIFDKNTLINDIEPYSRVSVYDLNDKIDPAGLDSLVSLCRPRSGEIGTPYAADSPHPDQGTGFTKKQFRNWARAIWGTHKTLNESTAA